MTKFSHLSKKQPKAARTARRFSITAFKLKTVNMTLGTLILVLGVGYLVQVNGIAAKGYQIRELEDQISELRQQNEDLELESLQLQSMGSVKDKVVSLGMVDTGTAEFLVVSPVAVAP